MTDMPEQLWAVHHETHGSVMIGEWADTIRHIGGTEYRRADLPPTLEQALAIPEVKALVDAAKGLLFAHDHGNGLEGWRNTRERVRSALRSIEGEGE